MKYKIKYLIYRETLYDVNIIRDHYKDYYVINNEMNKDEEIEIEIEIKEDDEFSLNYIKRYNCLMTIRGNKVYIGINDEDLLKFTKQFSSIRNEIKLIKDVVIEEIIG